MTNLSRIHKLNIKPGAETKLPIPTITSNAIKLLGPELHALINAAPNNRMINVASYSFLKECVTRKG